MKFDIDGFKNREFCVNCQTENEAKEFLSLLHHCGLTWAGGYSLLRETNWDRYQEDTYYIMNRIWAKSNQVCYGSIDRMFKKDTNFPIISFSEVVYKKVEIDSTELFSILGV